MRAGDSTALDRAIRYGGRHEVLDRAAGRRGGGGRFGRRGGGSLRSAPVNTVAPVASGTVTIGGTLSVTTGTWTGSPTPTYTYQWQRGATIDGVGSYANIGSATASSYTPVAADMGYSLRCVVTATNAVLAVSANSNALRYDPKTLYRTVYDPKSAGGFVDDVGTSGANDLTARGNPTSSSSDANFNNEPTVTADGTGDDWTVAAFNSGGNVAQLAMFMVCRINTASAGDGFFQLFASGGASDVRLRQLAGPVMQITGTGAGSAVSTSTTNLAGTKLVGLTWASGGNQSVYYKTTAEDTDANTLADLANNGAFFIASLNGAGDAAITIGLAIVHNVVPTAGALADLGAYCTNRFGAGVGS